MPKITLDKPVALVRKGPTTDAVHVAAATIVLDEVEMGWSVGPAAPPIRRKSSDMPPEVQQAIATLTDYVAAETRKELAS